MAARKLQMVAVSSLTLDPNNARKHGERDVAAIAASLTQFGQQTPIVVDADNVVVKGNGTLMAAMSLGWKQIEVLRTSLTGQQLTAYAIADNQTGLLSEWDMERLAEQLAAFEDDALLAACGFDDAFLQQLLEGETTQQTDAPGGEAEAEAAVANQTLAERFMVVPFTVLSAREGWWQARKRAWLALGIRSEIGRGESLLGFSDTCAEAFGSTRMANGKRPAAVWGGDILAGESKVVPGGGGKGAWLRRGEDGKMATEAVLMKSLSGRVPDYYEQKRAAEAKLGRTLENAEFERDHLVIPDGGGLSSSGTSVFDPVLAELCYRWFCPPGGTILDPFAGGSVRGIVASRLGRPYVGVDLRPEQIDANREQGERIAKELPPTWHVGDSRDIASIAAGVEADFVFSCPPYADLEIYSDDPADISTLAYPEFLEAYRAIIAATCGLLRENRFAAFVVGEVRDKAGKYLGFVPDTIKAFEAAGLRLYNEAILVTSAGSLPIRAGAQFSKSRKLGKTHQNVLVFVKGDPALATQACGEVEVATPEELAVAGDPEG